jgi:hypothetical protein
LEECKLRHRETLPAIQGKLEMVEILQVKAYNDILQEQAEKGSM